MNRRGLEEVELKPEEEKKPKIQVEQVNFLENFYKKYPQYRGYKSDADMITAITNKFPQYKDVVIKFEEEKKKKKLQILLCFQYFKKKFGVTFIFSGVENFFGYQRRRRRSKQS